ncbi:MAG TPA: carboxypeptidase regulatory-like domain-containing protein [Pyrinomonadaceae bacterium]|nr:carboxypeptidase regulatory-like domain-containing protein [Pyrinomonadaceae bacterium]
MLKLIVSILSVFALTSAIAFGQGTTGAIEGTVKDEKGAVVPGATVTLAGLSAGFNQTTTSNDSGSFRFERVPGGRYKVTVGAISGFVEKSMEVLVLSEKTSTADVVMGTTITGIDVTVGADPLGVVVDSTDSKASTTVTAELADRLPLGTSFTSILKLSPGTRGESLTGGFTVDGASKAENSFVLDGQEVTSYRYGTLDGVQNVPTALIKEVSVKTGGFEAEFGGASGGVISVLTKSGTNDMHGEFGSQFTTSKLQPNPRFVTSNYAPVTGVNGIYPDYQRFYAIQAPKTNSLAFEPTASLGGRIVKDHLWFYGIYAPQIYSSQRTTKYYNAFTAASGPVLTPTAGAAFQDEIYSASERYEYAQGRLDYSLFNKLNGFSSFLWNPHIVDGILNSSIVTGGAGTPTQQGYTQTGPSLYNLKGGRENANLFTTQATYLLLNNLAITGRYGRGFQNSKPSAYAAFFDTNFRCRGSSSSVFYTSGATQCPSGFNTSNTGNGGVQYEVSKRSTFNIDAQFLFNAGGSHILKGGYERAKLFASVKGSTATVNTNGRVTLNYNSNPNTATGGLVTCNYIVVNPNPTDCIGWGELVRYGESGAASNLAQALYIQDKWTISRLTLNLGVRAESENLPAFNTGAGSQAIPIQIGWGKKITPRLGASYDIFGKGKSRIYGSYGDFSDRMKFELPIGSFGGALYQVDYFPIRAANVAYSYYTVPRILGNWNPNAIGGGNPSTQGGLSQYQVDYRIPSNLPPSVYQQLVGEPFIGVDPDLKPFRQREITVGFETELMGPFVLNSRFTQKKLINGVEDIGYIDNGFNEYYTIGNPGQGVALEQRVRLGYSKHAKARRDYNAFEIGLTKRFSSNYYFNVNYTYSRLKGNYSGLASSDYFDGGSLDGSSATRSSPGVNRFFDWAINGFTAQGTEDYGYLPTDRPHVFKAYGGYNFDWWGSKSNSTEFTFFTTAQSGSPQTTAVEIVQTFIVWKERGDLGRTPWLTSTDLGLTHTYKFGRDSKYKIMFDITALNAFNENNVTALNPSRWFDFIVDAGDITAPAVPGAPANFAQNVALQNAILNGTAFSQINAALERPLNMNKSYGTPSSYQAARNIRFGFRFVF